MEQAKLNSSSSLKPLLSVELRKNKPARSAFAGNGLAMGARVEIECIATVNEE